MNSSQAQKIFKAASVTHYYASIFFPKRIRNDVIKFYAFVRIADDLAENTKTKEEYDEFRDSYFRARQGEKVVNTLVSDYVSVEKKRFIPNEYMDAFFSSMDADKKKYQYENFEELDKYIYGSAEVIGLVLTKIMQLSDNSYEFAQKLGYAYQYANFIRDIDEDRRMGRTYIPIEEFQKFGIDYHKVPKTEDQKKQFKKFLRAQIERYRVITKEAEKGFHFIPWRMRLPIKASTRMYNWTMDKIYQDPMIVYKKKVKPTKNRVIFSVFESLFSLS